MSGETILVVDDSPTELSLIADALTGKGYRLVTAADGDEALEKAQEIHPSLILLDVILPKKNGFQVCRQLKTAPDTKEIPIVLVTSKSQDSDRFWGIKQGADDYITKPFGAQDLLASIRKHLK